MDEITFDFQDFTNLFEYEDLYNKLLNSTKEVLEIKYPLSLGVNFITGINSQEINRTYRNKDYIADVISFPIDDENGLYEQIGFREIGDIFICHEEALRKAEKFNHTINEEMAWLFVHGLLHILGYDHETNEDEAKIMFDLTDEILKKQNLKYVIEF